jgi:hypothetical protein
MRPLPFRVSSFTFKTIGIEHGSASLFCFIGGPHDALIASAAHSGRNASSRGFTHLDAFVPRVLENLVAVARQTATRD